jgi:hypothetical protein
MNVAQEHSSAKWDNVLQIIRVDENHGTVTAIFFDDIKQLVR